MDPVLEIKARLPIDQLVSQYCQLKKKGRQYVALCPFHNDTHPSLLVSPDKGIAYCFACSTGGDVFSFYQAIEGVDFRKALEDLADRAGVKLEKHKQQSGQKDDKEQIRSCLQEAQRFFRKSLEASPKAKEYLQSRSVPEDLQETFGLGFAPDSFDALYTQLLKSGYARSTILSAGLGVQQELKEERIYDRFRNRITFPILDPTGRCIGFGGRTIGDADAKYINSPDGPLYHKSLILFGLPQAKDAMRRERSVVLVEGYFDVLACHRSGVHNVVAPCGTALTTQQTLLLKRYVDEAVLCLDADRAGWEAQLRAFGPCQERELRLSTMVLPMGKDPDECSLSDPAALRRAWEHRTSFLDSLVERSHAEVKASPGDARPRLRQTFLSLLSVMTSAVERERAAVTMASVLQTSTTALLDDLGRFETSKTASPKRDGQRSILRSPFTPLELLLGVLLTYPTHKDELKAVIEPEGDRRPPLYATLRSALERNAWPSGNDDVEEGCRERALILTLYCEEHFGAWAATHALKEVKQLVRRVNLDTLRGRQRDLLSSLRAARQSGRKAEEQKLLMTFEQVLKLNRMAG